MQQLTPTTNNLLAQIEAVYTKITKLLMYLSAILIAFLLLPIGADIFWRFFLGSSISWVMDIETLTLVLIGFFAIAYATATKSQLCIDMFYKTFSEKNQQRLDVFSHLLSFISSLIMAYFTAKAAIKDGAFSAVLDIPFWYFIAVTSFSFMLLAVGELIHLIKELINIINKKDYLGLLIVVLSLVFLSCLPIIYKSFGFSWSNLTLGTVGFLFLICLLLVKVPIGYAMMFVTTIGLLTIMRNSIAVGAAVGQVPFRQGSDFIFLAIPMFMLMGEMISMAGLSESLFDCAKKWLGKLPGGLACASVGGCAGFGAVCGDSMATVITMSSVAYKPMEDSKYAPSLACGSLAAGGTLGILIPPSMGFIVYSMMTNESVGQLFVAGILPGVLLATIFISIIVFSVKRNPSLAPIGQSYPLKEKLASLVGLIPILLLFIVVVGGIMYGKFTPGEGGAVGALCAIIYAAMRRRLTWELFSKSLISTATMCGKIFLLMTGVMIFGIFLTASRLPMLLSDWVIGLEANRYIILSIVIVIYVILGCIMNIIPMMMLTLPSIFPTIQALGFDGIWFGVITVIVMEMGMITPPVGMNVFTMGSLVPSVQMATIFRGVMPFLFGMILCVILIILFPQIALFLPSALT